MTPLAENVFSKTLSPVVGGEGKSGEWGAFRAVSENLRMSTEPNSRSWTRSPLRVLLVALAVVVLIGMGIKGVLNSIHPPPPRSTHRTASRPEVPLEIARETVVRSQDLAACKVVVQQMNEYFNRAPGSRPEPPSDAQRDFLKQQFHLDEPELAEVAGGNYTALDANYLDLCLLSRDALRALLGQEDLGKQSRSPEQVAAVFGWVMRQVQQIGRPAKPFPPHFMVRADEVVPPQFILRRGEGMPIERALIFLALLQQLDVPGCLLLTPAENGLRFWACGALIEQEGRPQVFVFDPRLGLPLPGPNGRGIATLAQLSAQPELLKLLTVDEKYPYDVTPEQVKRAEVHLVCPISAVAPRLRYLQDRLADTDPAVRAPASVIRLALDAEEMQRRFRTAVGPETAVKFAADLSRLQSTALPPDEGGSDRSNLLSRFRSEMVPWRLLPEEIQDMPGEPGQRLQSNFGQPFLTLWMEPRKPRDLMLRGQFTEASLDLVGLQDELDRSETQAQSLPDNWREQMEAWRQKINAAHAALLRAQRSDPGPAVDTARAQVNAVWQEGRGFLQPLILSRSVPMRSQQASYLLALSKLEQAEQLQTRLDRLKQTTAKDRKSEADRKAAVEAWRSAAQCWEAFADKHSDARHAPSARRLHARARMMLGEPERAALLLRDLSGEQMTSLEKTAHLYLAHRAESRE